MNEIHKYKGALTASNASDQISRGDERPVFVSTIPNNRFEMFSGEVLSEVVEFESTDSNRGEMAALLLGYEGRMTVGELKKKQAEKAALTADRIEAIPAVYLRLRQMSSVFFSGHVAKAGARVGNDINGWRYVAVLKTGRICWPPVCTQTEFITEEEYLSDTKPLDDLKRFFPAETQAKAYKTYTDEVKEVIGAASDYRLVEVELRVNGTGYAYVHPYGGGTVYERIFSYEEMRLPAQQLAALIIREADAHFKNIQSL